MFSFCLCFLGFNSLSDLGHDQFEVRDQATQKIKEQFPVSSLALYHGLFSNDPEVKYRCNLILREKDPSLILAKKMSNKNISKILSSDDYPQRTDHKFLENAEEWNDFCDVVVAMKLHDPKKEVMLQENREGAMWMMWARAKAVRYGQDPKIGSNRMPEIIKPGQEPKKSP